MQEINENSEKNSDEDDAFQETEWMDFAEGYYSRMQKKVNLIFKKKIKKIIIISHAVDSLKALFFCLLLRFHCLFSILSGRIGLDLCAVACASTLHKTSTTSGAMSPAATVTSSPSVR